MPRADETSAFDQANNPASSARTRALPHWEPAHAGLLADLKILTPAQHQKLHAAAIAFRARTPDPQSADLYLAQLLH